VELAEELRWIAEDRQSMASASLRWILDHEEVSCIIPGFKNEQQVIGNLVALQEKSFSQAEKTRLQDFYQQKVKNNIRGPY